MADAIEADIIDRITTAADSGSAGVGRTTELTELGIHSLELTEIIFDIEEKYGIEVRMDTAEAWNKLRNVGDIVDAVRGLVAGKA